MSYLMYNPLSPGTQNASQGQTDLFNVKTERDPWRTTPNVGPESSFTFPGVSPGTPTSSKEREMKPFSLPIGNYRPENYLTTSQSTFHIPHKEEIKHQPIDQCAFFTITQRETLSISAPKMSASYGHQLSSTSCSSYNLFTDHKSTTEDFSKLASNVSVYSARAEDQRVSSQPRYFDCNPQLAGNILENYGLEKADLDELLNYSEEETTAENLPYLLQSIRMKKATKTAPGVRSNSDSMTRPTASITGVDAVNFGKPGILQNKMSSSTLPHSEKIIKNEQAAAGSAEVDAAIGRNIQRNFLPMDNFQTSSKEGPVATLTKIERGDLGSSGDQKGSFVVVPPPRVIQTRLLQTQPSQASEMTPSIGFGQTETPNEKSKMIIKPVKPFECEYTGKSITDLENTSVREIHNAAEVGGKDDKEAPQLSLAELKNNNLVSSYDQNVSAAGFNQLNSVAFPKSNAAGKLGTQQSRTSQSVPQHQTRVATFSGENKIQRQGSNIADSTMNLQMLQKTNIQKILQILKDSQPDVSSAAKQDSQSPFIPKMPHVENTSVREIHKAAEVGGKGGKEAPQLSLAELKNNSLVSSYDQNVSAAGFNQLNAVAFPKRNAAGKLGTQQNRTSQSVPQHQTRVATFSGENKIQRQGSNIADSTMNLQMLQKTNIQKILQILKDSQPDVSSAAKQDSQSPFIPKMPHVENTSVREIHNAAEVGGKGGKEAPQLSLAELKNNSLVSSYDQNVSAAGFDQLNAVAFPKSNAAGKLGTQQNRTSQSVPQLETRDATSIGENKIRGPGSNIAHSTMNLQMLQKTNIQKFLQILKDSQPDVSSAAKSDSQSPFIPKMPHVSDVVLPSTVVTKNPPSSVSQSQTIIKTNNNPHVPSSKPQPPVKSGSSKDLPSLDVRRDYAAVMPGRFPHICSLCKKECPQLKDWVTHQTSNQHHANCNRLLNQYPHWDGKVQRDAIKSSKTLTRASLHRRSRSNSSTCPSSGDGRGSRSRSRSYSPRYRRSSRDGKHKYSSRSRHSKNRSSKSSSSHSYSPIRHGSRDRKKQSNSSSYQHRLQCRTSRSSSRSYSPRYNRSAYRSRSRSYEKWSSPKRMNKKSISPRRSHKRLSRGRSCERRSSTRSDRTEGSKRFLEHQYSSRISDYKRLSPRSGCVRQMSPKRTDKRWSPTSNGEQLSPSRSGNGRWSPVMRQHSSRSNDRLWSPQRRTDVGTNDKHRSPARRADDKHRTPPRRACDKYWSSPRRGDDKHRTPPRRACDKYWSSPRSGDDKHRSPPRRADEKYWSSTRRADDMHRSPPRRTDDKYWSSPRRTDDKYWSPPRRTDDKYWSSPRRADDKHRSSPRRADDKHRSSPRRADDKHRSSPRRADDKHRSSPRRADDKHRSPPRRADDKYWSPPRRADNKYWSPPKYHDRQLSPRRIDDKRWSPARKHESSLERDEQQFLSKQSDEEASRVRRNRKRHASPEEPSCQKKKSSSVQILTKRLLENSAIESASGQSNIKDVVDLMVPVLLAELAKKRDSSHSSLGLPSQDKRTKVLTDSSSGRQLSPSSTKILSKLEQKHARSAKKTKDKRALSITSQHRRNHQKLRSGDTKKLGSSESLDLLPIKTLLSLHHKLVKKAKRLSSKGTHVSKSKTCSQKTQGLKSVVSVKEPLKQLVSLRVRSLETSPQFGLSNRRSGPIVFRKDQDLEAGGKEKTRDKGIRRIIIPEPNEEKKTITKVKLGSSKTSASKPLDKTAECARVAKLIKVEDSLGNKQQTSNASQLQLVGKMVTPPNPLQAQETIIKTQETSSKTLPKVQQKMDPESKKSKSLGIKSDSGDRRDKPGANVFKEGKETQVAVKDPTMVGKILKKTVAEANKGKEMVTKVKVNASKTSSDTLLDKTTKCSAVAKLTKVEDFLGDEWQTSNVLNPELIKIKPLIGKVVTRPHPLQDQETIIKTFPEVQPRMDPDSKKSKSLGKNTDSFSGTSTDSGGTRNKPATKVFKKGKGSQVAAKDRTKIGKMLKKTVTKAMKGKKMTAKVKVNASKTSSDTLLDKTTICSGVAKLTKVEDFLEDERQSSNVSHPELKKNKPLIGKVVTRPHPIQAQETIIKTFPKVQTRMDPDSKKSKSLGKNPDSGGTRNKPAFKPAFKKGKGSQVAAKDGTKIGKMLKKTVTKAMKGKKMAAKVKVKAPKTSTNNKLDETIRCLSGGKVEKLSEKAFGNFSKCDQANIKESEPSLSVSVITSTIPMTKNSPGGCQTSKPEFSKAKSLQFITNESQLQISQEKEETSSENLNVSSKLTMSEGLSAVCQTLKTDSSEIKVDKSAFLSKDTAWLVKANVSTAEISKQTEVITDANVMKRKMDFLETKGDEVTATNASPAKPEHPQPGSEVVTITDKPADPMLSQQTTITTQESPDLAALNLKTNGKQLEVQPQSAGSSPLDESQKTERDNKNNQKADVLAQKNPAACFPNAAAVAPSRVGSSVTVGERIRCYLKLHNFKCVPAGIILSSKPYALNSTLLLITNLPVDYSGSYTEEEVVNMLCKFEFQYAHDNIYIIPQTGMAFVLMPNVRSVIGLVLAAVHDHLYFRSKKLFLQIVETNMLMTPLGFYKSLIRITPLNMRDDGTSIIYIQNISPSDISDLRKALRKISNVRNFLPLLNKVFVEFETVYDADRLGVWCSLMRLGFVQTVNRLKIPRSFKKSQPPKLPLKALPDSEKILPGAGIPDVKCGVPQGTTAPCWVTMTTPPYVFPTVCPWFNIPSFLTVHGEEDILTTPHPASEFFTVMLTGLPEGKYKHEDVAKLVWRYFPKQNLQTLYYNILVLPLQRRAFVFFCDWEACCSFVSDCVKKPVSVRNCTLSVHLVLEDMYPGSSEETMYRTLMKWTSGYVPELFFLEKRLVSVEIYEANMNLIENIIKEVAAIGSFISFVPLTNRICIEMVSPSCATKVLQDLPLRKVLSTYLWEKVGRVERVKDLNQRLEEAGEIKLQAEASAVSGQPSALKTLVDFPVSEPGGDDAAGINSAAPPTLIESMVSKSESKLEEKVSEPPDVVLDSKAEANSTEEECRPCREISSAGDNSVGCTAYLEEKIQMDPPSIGVIPDESTEMSPSVQTEAEPEETVKEQPVGADSHLTAGERIGSLLQPERICCLGHSIIMSPKPFSLQSRLLLVTNLPPYRDGCYSESDISNLLCRFGFQYEDRNIFVVPQACMAFVLMESYQKAQEVFIAAKDCLSLNGCKLSVEIISSGVVMTTFGFYKSLMDMIDSPVTDDGTRTVYIQNVSPSEARELRETLRKMGSVKNYLPLLNKVFIEFESAADADQIGVWYSLRRRWPAHNVSRIKLPQTRVTSLTPHLVAAAVPESKDIIAGSIVPPMNTSVPEGSWAPFSVAMTTAPFLFPTVSPWFIIPKFRTVDKEEDLLASVSVASKFSTVMLTGLPEGNYKHEDVAKLVWKYFTTQNLQTLFYNIVVLPLQKRAFVYFNNWKSCNNFVQDFLKKGVSFTSHQLHIHLVLEEMNPGSSEDMVYQTLMKWSNAHVPELESLDERLVCVALSETSLNLIMATVKLVTSISPVVSFLPLANRLCIEMAESTGVDQVVERFSRTPEDWNNQVQSVESVKSLKLRLKDSGETKIDLEPNIEDINDKTAPPSSDTPVKTKPPVQEVTNLPNNAPPPEELPAKGSGTKTKIGGTENENVQSKVSEKQSDVSGKVRESAVVPRDKTETEKRKQQAKTVEVKEDKSENAAKSKVGKTEDEKLSPAKPTNTLISTSMVKTQPSTPLTNPHKSQQTSLQTCVKGPSQLQEYINPKPGSSSENPKTKTNMSGNSAAVENPAPKVSAASAEIVPNTKSSTTATKPEPLAATTPTEAFPLTPGEKLHHFLTPFKLRQLDINTVLSPMVFSLNITLVVTNLPRWFDGSYTETEIINVLQKCRVHCDENEIFIVPQSQMAFLIMPRAAEVQHLFRVTPWRELFFKGRKLGFHVVTSSAPMTLFRFYRYLMSFTDFSTFQMKLGTRNVLYFPNISASEARDLREALRKISSFINYLPLLNRVFVHCEAPEDADRLEAWYSYWRWSRSHDVQQTALSLSAHALQIWENISVETSVPQTAGAIPEGTKPPFWLTVMKTPYVVHTASPFFKVPAFQTVDRNICARISERDLKFAAIMLTGLPNRSYTHEEVAMLVWRHFPQQNLHTLYNNVVVLPLQRRAFVFFSSSLACIRFLRDRNRKRVYFKGFIPNIHLLLEDLSLGSSEESMFRSLMKWSNIHVPDLTSLGERLLVVEASGTNEHITTMVMKEVASIATFASFLPLANRIYIEMAESSGVRKVLEKLSVHKLSQQHQAWNLVGRVESLLSRKERLKDCEKIAVNLELGTMSVKPEATPLKMTDKRSATCNPLPERSLTTSHKGSGFLQISSGSASSFKGPSSSKPTTKEIKISHSSAAARDISKSNKDCKSSASSIGSTKSSLMSSATSSSIKTQKDALEHIKPQANQYSSAGGSKVFPSSLSKTFKSLGSVNEKDQQSKREAPLRAPQTSSASSSQSTSSPATSAETPQSDKHGAVLTPVAVEKADHKVSAESSTAKSQLGPREATSNLNQDCFKAETLKEETEGKEKQKQMDNNMRNHVKQGNDPLNSKHIELLVAIKEEKPLGKYEDSKVIMDQRMKTSCGEEGHILPIKQESSDKNHETKVKESNSETGEKTVCKDSVPDESPIHTFVKKTDKGANQDETNQEKSATVVRTASQSGKDAYAEQKEIRKDGLEVSAQEEKPLVKDEGLAVKLDKKTKVSESEDGQNSAKEQSLNKQTETQSKDINAEMETEEMVYMDSVQHKSGLRRSFRQTTRLANQEKTNENKAAEGGKLTESNSLVERKEDKTPTRSRKTPARDPQQQNEKKTLVVKPKTCNSRETPEKEKEAATPRRRGRSKKKVRLVPEKTLEVSPTNIPSMTCNSKETKEEEKEAAKPRRSGRPKKNITPVPVQHKRKMDLSGPEPKRSCSGFAPVAAGV